MSLRKTIETCKIRVCSVLTNLRPKRVYGVKQAALIVAFASASCDAYTINSPDDWYEVDYSLKEPKVEPTDDNESNRLPGDFLELLTIAIDRGASDIHLIAGRLPAIRVHGFIQTIGDQPVGDEALEAIRRAILDEETNERFEGELQVDCSLDFPLKETMQRFRANLFLVGSRLGICLRHIPAEIPSLSWAGFPESLAKRLTSVLDGLVIITGATGSGKTTTLAMLIDKLSQLGGLRIITIEEPVEYVFPARPQTLITQRELGPDVHSFADGLKAGLRQDPDVILVGEVRDRETAEMVLAAAETGHLVFTTLHTRDSKGAISRFAGFFPQSVQADVRYQLSLSLRAVVAQRLLPNIQLDQPRQLAIEALWNTNPIASAIRTGKLESIDNYLITNRHDGMMSFDETVAKLFREGKITRDTAERNVKEMNFLGR